MCVGDTAGSPQKRILNLDENRVVVPQNLCPTTIFVVKIFRTKNTRNEMHFINFEILNIFETKQKKIKKEILT